MVVSPRLATVNSDSITASEAPEVTTKSSDESAQLHSIERRASWRRNAWGPISAVFLDVQAPTGPKIPAAQYAANMGIKPGDRLGS